MSKKTRNTLIVGAALLGSVLGGVCSTPLVDAWGNIQNSTFEGSNSVPLEKGPTDGEGVPTIFPNQQLVEDLFNRSNSLATIYGLLTSGAYADYLTKYSPETGANPILEAALGPDGEVISDEVLNDAWKRFVELNGGELRSDTLTTPTN